MKVGGKIPFIDFLLVYIIRVGYIRGKLFSAYLPYYKQQVYSRGVAIITCNRSRIIMNQAMSVFYKKKSIRLSNSDTCAQ